MKDENKVIKDNYVNIIFIIFTEIQIFSIYIFKLVF